MTDTVSLLIIIASVSLRAAAVTCPAEQMSCGPDEPCLAEKSWCDGEQDCPSNEDEANCTPCPDGFFTCGPGASRPCLLKRFLCDKTDDCGNSEDEKNEICFMCPENQMRCGPDGPCVWALAFCDNGANCPNGEDEVDCSHPCPVGFFTCTNGGRRSCLADVHACDGSYAYDSCSEAYCSPCPDSHFTCGVGGTRPCLPRRYACDGIDHCGNNADESDAACRPCATNYVACGSGGNRLCIPDELLCDGLNDCGDNSDEADCEHCPSGYIACGSTVRRSCLPARLQCDDKDHCGDGTDEQCNCKRTTEGFDYAGHMNKTVNGRDCQPWASDLPRRHKYDHYDTYPEGNAVDAKNYCRNPDRSAEGPWCYTMDPNVTYELCDIPLCSAGGGGT